MKMKKLILPLRLLLIAVLIAAVALTIASCGNGTNTGTQKATEAATETGTGTGTPETAAPVEIEKLEVGEGAKTITVNVKKDNAVYEIAVKTDAENLEDRAGKGSQLRPFICGAHETCTFFYFAIAKGGPVGHLARGLACPNTF